MGGGLLKYTEDTEMGEIPKNQGSPRDLPCMSICLPKTKKYYRVDAPFLVAELRRNNDKRKVK